MKFFDYVKAAFLNHYNLMLLGAGLLFSLMSGAIAGGFALFTAIELVYLMAMASNLRFQRAMDAIYNNDKMQEQKAEKDRKLQPILRELCSADRDRFDMLCEKCKSIQQNMLMSETEGMTDITNAQAGDVNRLLWIFLKILVARKTVSSFVETISEKDLTNEVKKQGDRLAKLPVDAKDENVLLKQKRAAIEDMLRTATKRLENFKLTRGNIEIFDLRLEQIETKLNALSEVALNRHDSSSIAISIDMIARDVEISEGTINELKDATGMTLKFEEAPAIMSTYEGREDRNDRTSRSRHEDVRWRN